MSSDRWLGSCGINCWSACYHRESLATWSAVIPGCTVGVCLYVELSRPDPLTRDLVHLINARRHDHGDYRCGDRYAASLLGAGREYDLLTVLAALDEDMAEWLFDLLAEASCSVLIDGPADDKLSYAIMAALELPLQANLVHPLKLKIDPVATADLLHRHLRLSAGTVVRVESRLLTDSTLERSASRV